MTHILFVGGADTGRAPIAAALLHRLIEQQNLPWSVSSAGVLGHDGDPAEVEARDAMMHLGIDISDHLACSVTRELVDQSHLLITLDHGITIAVNAHHPHVSARVHTLGALANRQRNIPDPFRMQMGAWLTYAKEIEALLEAALPRMQELLADDEEPTTTTKEATPIETPAPTMPQERLQATGRIQNLLKLMRDMPNVVDWSAARVQIDNDLTAADSSAGSADLIQAYIGVLRAALNLTANPPTSDQLDKLHNAVERLHYPISQHSVAELSGQLGNWAAT